MERLIPNKEYSPSTSDDKMVKLHLKKKSNNLSVNASFMKGRISKHPSKNLEKEIK
jgi:hypothetical protein